MKRFITSFVLVFIMGALFAENGTLTVTSVESTPVTGITVITYDLTAQTPDKVSETYNISVEVSFEGGVSGSYIPVPSAHLSGDVEHVAPGTGRQITWDGGAGFPNRYSEEAKLKLTASPITSGTFADARDGQTYKWVKIGNQVWMAENLKYLPSVAREETGSETQPYYYVLSYKDTDPVAAKATARYQEYGVLYNWPAAMNEALSSDDIPSGVQGACPTGWHLPSYDEWIQLVDYVVSEGYPIQWNDPNGAGNALKSCRQENSPLGGDCNTTVHPRWAEDKWSGNNHHGFDAFGFAALPGASRSKDGHFFSAGWSGNWWLATEESQTHGKLFNLDNGDAIISSMSYEKSCGFSIRCVKN